MPVKGTTMTSYRPLMQGVNGNGCRQPSQRGHGRLGDSEKRRQRHRRGVAVGLALNVVHVDDCSFLGVAPTVIYLADRKEVVTVDGLGVWPKAASVEYFPQAPRRQDAGRRDVVPDAGRRRFVDHVSLQVWHDDIRTGGIRRHRAGRQRFPPCTAIWPGGSRPPSTSTMPTRQPPRSICPAVALPSRGRCSTRRTLPPPCLKSRTWRRPTPGKAGNPRSKQPGTYIYTGELAQKIVAFNQEMGGLLTEDDLARYHVQVTPPVAVNYKGYDVYSTGPWGPGADFPPGPQDSGGLRPWRPWATIPRSTSIR